jgi:Leucine Rich repeats (2 copies)/4Fe-4S single cluster domain of Ferredoxin I
LERLASLQSLVLSNCWKLSDISPLAGLKSLQKLDLSGCNELSGDLSPLARLTSLRSLSLNGFKQLSDLSSLAGLTSLQTLNLSDCEQLNGDLSPLAGLTFLQSLDLCFCKQLSGDLSPLASLTSLQRLDLTGCRQLSGDLSPLARLNSLKGLRLYECLGFHRFAPLESLLPTLIELILWGCKFDDLPPESSAQCGQKTSWIKSVPTTRTLNSANGSTRRSNAVCDRTITAGIRCGCGTWRAAHVFRQPITPEEEALCKEAMEGCPVEAIGNNGEG